MMRRTLNGISSKRARAFSLIEILIAVIIVAILGGVAITALWLFFFSFSQMDDYTSAEFELNYAAQRLKSDLALVGLGMPNNREGKGTFAATFRRGPNVADWPIMAWMGAPVAPGAPDNFWGGPVTVAGHFDMTLAQPIVPVPHDAAHGFVGPQLFYAWGIPTGMNAWFQHSPPFGEAVRRAVGNHARLQIFPFRPDTSPHPTSRAHLENVRHDGRMVGLESSALSQNTRSWLLFPTFKLPMLFEEWEGGNNSFIAHVAPTNTLNVTGTIMELDEIHLVQAARLFRENNDLVRVIFTGGGQIREVLARNIVGLQFAFNPESRLLTMFMASRGHEPNPAGGRGQPAAWPPPPFQQLDPEDTRFRIVVKTLTWRIRN